MRWILLSAAVALPALVMTGTHADEVHTHIGTLVDYVDISTYQQVCAKIARTPNTRVDKIATIDNTKIPFSFRWQCIGHQLFLNDGGEACQDADNPIRCHGEPAKTSWIRITTQGPSTHRPLPADLLPRDALKTYCASAGDTTPAIFGDGRTGPPIVWRCVKGTVYTCEAGADGVACSARSRSRAPGPSMVKAYRDYGQLSVADGALSTVWRCECRDGKPLIAWPQMIYDLQTKTTTPAEFDAQGYAEGEWTPLR